MLGANKGLSDKLKNVTITSKNQNFPEKRKKVIQKLSALKAGFKTLVNNYQFFGLTIFSGFHLYEINAGLWSADVEN